MITNNTLVSSISGLAFDCSLVPEKFVAEYMASKALICVVTAKGDAGARLIYG
jgi:hypothetical protein